MFELNEVGILYIEIFLQGFFYGIYSGIFALYLQYQASKKDTNRAQNIICCFMCALYASSVASFFCDITILTSQLLGTLSDSLLLYITFIVNTSFACCDFIAQFILIYRCWIVWGRNIRVAIMPSILAFAFLGTWLTSSYTTTVFSGHLATVGWQRPVILTSITLSLAVNALVTGLIVFRISKVFRGINTSSDDHILGATGGSKLRRIIFILIESGMALFSIQLARIVVSIMETQAASHALSIIASIHPMLNVSRPVFFDWKISILLPLGTWLTSSYTTTVFSGHLAAPGWEPPVILTSITLSLAVNALVTGLIVFRIFKVFREVKATSDDHILGATGGTKLRRIIFILIESGMALFSIQLARIVVTIMKTSTAFIIISPIHEMLNGITPTIIVVRTAMGLSFDDETSMEEVAIESLRFASDYPNSALETGSIGIVDQDRRDDDANIDIQRLSNDIEVVER